ncbi:YdaU family protein [Chitinasiproducens palmae]|uniref:DUF1376 domain-containing protein n=1 Tax=Chitinasiproducens palmae TaxID=1770053 RepID=A0A1H2PQI7_9BURK|nr:YdaU family protein [Chitinasiproducens palmae]SDV49086.1 Protein of unknown function [Chitinasiproducens palmae]
MNYYPHHIGDYLAATAHLTMVEDGAYRRLMDLYYTHEQALPADVTRVCRLARAMTADERAAVQTILEEFFTLENSGWTHKRCEEEIKKAQAAADRARENGRKGGRPRAQIDPKMCPNEADDEPTANPRQTQPVLRGLAELIMSDSRAEAPNPKPNPITQEPRRGSARDVARFEPQAHLESLNVEPDVARDWLKLRTSMKAPPSATAIRGIHAEARKAGLSLNNALLTCCQRGWKGFEASWLAREARASPSRDPRNRQEALEIRNRDVARRAAERYAHETQ